MSNNYSSQGDVLDILFANRNKTYGAYLLRRNYPARLKTALGIMLGAMALLSLGMEWKGKKEIFTRPAERKPVTVTFYPPPAPVQPILHPRVAPPAAAPALPKPVTPPAPPEANPLYKFVDQPKPIKTPPPVAVTDPIAVGTSTVNGVAPGNGSAQAGSGGQGSGGAGSGEASTGPYDIVQMMPSFPGGDEALKRFFMKYLQTPDELEEGAQVKVMVRFVVGKDGSISACAVDKSGGAAFDAEVLRVVRKMPRWKPGIQNGLPVPVYFMLPVTFMRAGD